MGLEQDDPAVCKKMLKRPVWNGEENNVAPSLLSAFATAKKRANYRNRTDDPFITNEMLCQLS